MFSRSKVWQMLALALGLTLSACSSDGDSPATGPEQEPTNRTWPCEIVSGSAAPDSLTKIGCQSDFDVLASAPLDSSIPGARSGKVVLDQLDGDALYFQNSVKYPIHHAFAWENLSRPGFEVPLIGEFNRVQYYQPDRRFLLASVTYYEAPDIWALEIAPYDTMDAAMMEKLYTAVADKSFFGPRLAFVPTSDSVETAAKTLSSKVRQETTENIFKGTLYQPLNLGRTVALLRFLRAADLAKEYVGPRDLVVLDEVPNDISVVSGLITQEFQTPLSHVNVLAQNRKTPNMGLRSAMSNATLRALEGKWVELVVGANGWTIREATAEEANAFWMENAPDPVKLPALDLTVRDLRDIELVTDDKALPLKDAVQLATRAFGAKSANYSVLRNTPNVPIRKAFGIPVYYYVQFMEENGFFAEVDRMLADPTFQNSPKERDTRLAALRESMKVAPVNAEFQKLLRAKFEADYPGLTMRFRTSTNAEDLDGFPCAGCYDSHTGDPKDWEGDLLEAVRKTWAGVWFFRTFEERAYHSIDHKSVGMALLVHHNFPAEEANGVALTANPFDPSGLEPGFYVNVQWGGDFEVVHPPAGSTSDEFLYFFDSPNQPTTYLAHSNLVPVGQEVLTRGQIYELGVALKAIHERYSAAYGPKAGNQGWYAMDVEFKYDDEDAPGQPAKLLVKQARPHPGRGQ